MNKPTEALLEGYQEQMRRMDELEARIDARAARTRRRITSLLDLPQYSTTTKSKWPVRNSHVRMWVTHKYQPASESNTITTTATTTLPPESSSVAAISGGATAETQPVAQAVTIASTAANQMGNVITGSIVQAPQQSQPKPVETTRPLPETFTLQIEGALLIGHLDHASAAAYDRKVGYTAPQDDLDRSRGEKEDDVPVPALHLTHLFDQLSVEFQTVYQPKIHPMARIPPPTIVKKKKSSRRSSAAATSTGSSTQPLTIHPDDVDLKTCILSERQQMTWTPHMTQDAHAWAFHYIPPKPASGAFQIHSVIVRIKLYPRAVEDRYYIQHPALVENMFPHHGPPAPTREELEQKQLQLSAQQLESTPKKRKAEDVIPTTADGHPLPPIDNEIHLPATLTMSEIIRAFYVYICDNRLMDDDDKTTIVCDALLEQALGVDRLPFSQLRSTLLSRPDLLVRATEPAQATYIMRRDTASNAESMTKTTTSSTTTTGDEPTPPAMWQWDMQCPVPCFFGFRARELLRRIKRRELEYTSSRTKARYLLAARRARNEDTIRQQIEAVVTGKSLTPDLLPVQQALARGAPPLTEARLSAQLDAQISYLLEQLPEHCRAANNAREMLDLLRRSLSEG